MPLMEQEYEDATVELCTRQFCDLLGFLLSFYFFIFLPFFGL